MPVRLNPYISFRTDAREAMTFYADVFGGELTVSTFGEMGSDGPEADLVMHAQLETDKGFTLMGSDTPPQMDYQPGTNMSVSISGDDGDDLRGYWDKLAANGTVTMPLAPQAWGDEFGMVTDRFGVAWMVNIAGSQAPQA